MSVTPPAIDAALLTKVDSAEALTALLEKNDGEVWDSLLDGLDLTGTTLRATSIKGCEIRGCRLTGARLERGVFSDLRFISCELSGAGFGDSRFTRCEFINCKMQGTILADCYFGDTTLRGCVAPLASFAGSQFFYLDIEETNLREADFTACKLKGTRLDSVNLERASFYRTPLAGIDLSRCDIMSLGVEAQSHELKGAKLDFTQLAELAGILGIEIV